MYDVGDVRFPSGVVPGSHDCVPPGGGGASIAWDELQNPIFTTEAMAKDQAIRFAGGRWHLLFSNRIASGPHAGFGHVASEDWTAWDWVLPLAHEGGSNDITSLADGTFVIAHQQERPDDPDSRMLVYRTTADLDDIGSTTFTQLFPEIHPQERLIDVALAHTEFGVFAIFKRGARESVVQVTTLAHSPSGSLDGPWHLVGDPDVGWFENYQFLVIDGKWHLLGTRIPVHQPELYRLDGDPRVPTAWLRWTPVGTLAVPGERWNSGEGDPGFIYERANSAFLCDARTLDGWFYLLYAGSTELTTNDGRGHAKIGVARSHDLVRWTVPPV